MGLSLRGPKLNSLPTGLRSRLVWVCSAKGLLEPWGRLQPLKLFGRSIGERVGALNPGLDSGGS